MNWGAWIYGLVGAIATGALSVIGALAAYKQPPENGWAWFLLLLPMISGFFLYLKQTPPPPWNGVERRKT